MSILFATIFVGLLCGSVSGCSDNDYALYFPNNGVTDYTNIWGMRSLTQFTVCFWMKSSDTNSRGTPFSYAVPGQDNELIIYNYKDFHLYIGGEQRITHYSANDGRWHHICTSWQSSDGAGKFYKDGILRWHGTGLKTGHTIQGGGSLVLGQEQDSLQGGFNSNQSFQGSLTNVNVWSYVLSASTIKFMSTSCLSGEGNVYKWSDFIRGVKEKTAVVVPSPCSPR
ncbi:neuronal pentraxin-1-like isoform X1 [Oculina patagonica]